MTVAEALAAGQAQLRQAGIDDPARDARRLVATALGIDPGRVTLALPDTMTEAAQNRFNTFLAARAQGVPVSQIVGGREFYGRWFKITRDVLDPRPETETLIEQALAEPYSTILDLGTGSGCILLTLLAERREATGLGLDISAKAIRIARQNADALDVSARAAWAVSDWYEYAPHGFDLIVSNPPYIAAAEMPGLAPELAHEPRIALTDEGDGLSAHRMIAAGARAHLAPGGRLLVEIGATQGQAVADLFRAAGLGQVTIHPDLDGRDRVVRGYAK